MNQTMPKQMGVSGRFDTIQTVSPEGTFCDIAKVPSGDGDMQLI